MSYPQGNIMPTDFQTKVAVEIPLQQSFFSSSVLIWKRRSLCPPLKEWFHSQALGNSSKIQRKYPVLMARVPWPCVNWCWWHSHVAVMPEWLKLLWGSVQRSLRMQEGQIHILTLADKYFSGIFSVVGREWKFDWNIHVMLDDVG